MQLLAHSKAMDENITRHPGRKCGQSKIDYRAVIIQILKQSNIKEFIYLTNDGKYIWYITFIRMIPIPNPEMIHWRG